MKNACSVLRYFTFFTFLDSAPKSIDFDEDDEKLMAVLNQSKMEFEENVSANFLKLILYFLLSLITQDKLRRQEEEDLQKAINASLASTASTASMNDNDENRPVPVPEHYLELVRSIFLFFFSLILVHLLQFPYICTFCANI